MIRRQLACPASAPCWLATGAVAQDKFIVVASTTSTEQSGLFAHLLPAFEKDTGIKVRVVALGTGQALDLARRGDADVVFVHDQPAEEKFVAEGFGVKRRPVMYNDFVLVGPEERSGEGCRRQGHPRRDAQGRRGAGAVRVARRQERHARGRASLLEGRRRRSRREEGRLVQGHGVGHGTDAQHGVVDERLRAHRPRHVAVVQESRRPRRSWSKATSASSTSTA